MAEAFGGFQYPTPPLSRLDVQRLYEESYTREGLRHGLLPDAEAEVSAEFTEDDI
ncbi:hypothetical protein [Streptomyces niveus]|uniref:hypothetical protein n=1 Tax=Streptomyces niveus TaxID=193462 RepID=UPI00365B6824